MKQKIVIKVPMYKEKDRSKAMQIVVGEEGVSSVSIGKENQDELEVIGEGVDSVCLAKSLRKKFRFAYILSVEEVKPPEPEPEPEPEPKPDPCPQPCVVDCPPPPCIYPPLFQRPYYDCQFYDTGPPNCSIM